MSKETNASMDRCYLIKDENPLLGTAMELHTIAVLLLLSKTGDQLLWLYTQHGSKTGNSYTSSDKGKGEKKVVILLMTLRYKLPVIKTNLLIFQCWNNTPLGHLGRHEWLCSMQQPLSSSVNDVKCWQWHLSFITNAIIFLFLHKQSCANDSMMCYDNNILTTRWQHCAVIHRFNTPSYHWWPTMTCYCICNLMLTDYIQPIWFWSWNVGLVNPWKVPFWESPSLKRSR